MHWWKQHPPGWYAWDRWYEDDPEGGGGDGDDEEDDSGDDDSGGDDSDSGGGDDNGGGGDDSGGDSGDDSGGGDSDFDSDLDSDGDAGDDDAVQREFERDQRDREREFEREREDRDREREQERQRQEQERAAQEAERERQRLEEEERQRELERQQQEAERQRQAQVAEQARLAAAYRTQGAQQQGVAFSDPILEPPAVPQPEDAFKAPEPQPEEQQPEPPPKENPDYVILHNRQTQQDVRLPAHLLPQVANLDEFEVRSDTASSPLFLQQSDDPGDAGTGAAIRADQTPQTTHQIIDAVTGQPTDQSPIRLPDIGQQGGLFDSRPQTPAPPPAQTTTSPEIAAQNAAAAAAATGADPATIAATAELAARIASDRQSLGQQTAWTRAAFRSEYGQNAEQEWVRQHEAELARNTRLYGSQEPTAGTAPLASAPAGTPSAPNRQIGAVPPPAPGEGRTLGAPPPPSAPSSPTPAPTASPASPSSSPAAGAGWAPLPGQTARPAPAAPSALPGLAPPTAPPTAGEPGGPPLSNDYPVLPNPLGDLPPPTAGEPGGPPLANDYPILANPYGAETNRAVRGFVPAESTQIVEVIGPDDQPHQFTWGEWEQVDPEVRNQYRGARILSPAEMGQHGGATSLPSPDTVSTLDQAIQSRTPLDALTSLALVGKGEAVLPENIRRDSYHLAQGISAMLSGNAEVTWPEPYLNDIARLAWTREESQSGRRADPRDAPVEYIEKWKDAFYGSDQRVPLVKEVDQQMIDYAASRTPPGTPFKWQDAYGPNGDRGLISAQVEAVDCGPNAFSTILRSRGYNTDPRTAFTFALKTGYHNGSEFTGPANMVRMLRQEAGLNASSVPISPDGKNWNQVDQELAEGRPVMLSSPGHYWVVSAKDPSTGKYYAGKTTLHNNPEWLDRGSFKYGGFTDTAIFSRGEVDPNSNAVKSMHIDPPKIGPADTRALLSRQTLGEPNQQRGGPDANLAPLSLSQRTGAPYQFNESTEPSPQANRKPTFTGDEAVAMRNRIMQEMPEINFNPDDGVETRMEKIAPALTWLKREYDIDDAALAAMAYNENHLGMANSPAVRGNNIWSVMYVPQDPLSSGPIPEGRWAKYPSIKAALARFVAMYSHPDNGYRNTWKNRQTTDGFLKGLEDDKYVVDEDGFPVSKWREGVKRGADLYNQVKSRTVTQVEPQSIGRGT